MRIPPCFRALPAQIAFWNTTHYKLKAPNRPAIPNPEHSVPQRPLMTIRQATPEDFDVIYSLVQTAFQTAKVSDGDEQDFVLKLRKGRYIPELELVAEENGVLIGHIMLTGASIRENGGGFDTLILAPLSVALEWRAKGVGAALIREALAKATSLGHSSAVLIGDPAYYGRFGFHAIPSITYPGVPGEYTLACELAPGALQNISGAITLPDF